ncbi:transient receptor potential cation channel subfamily V member 5-like isoform X2 [Sycon ciliatum]|uniref:transient receptor potential cation channel subfamily V member 5-like isoform X2 n=1 Tax=Sycon ciliatum TaxID=27933 RepID=UPI0031F619CA
MTSINRSGDRGDNGGGSVNGSHDQELGYIHRGAPQNNSMRRITFRQPTQNTSGPGQNQADVDGTESSQSVDYDEAILDHTAGVTGCGLLLDILYSGDFDVSGVEINYSKCCKGSVDSTDAACKAEKTMRALLDGKDTAPDSTWTMDDHSATVDYSCRTLTLFQFAFVRNKQKLAKTILDLIPADKKGTFLKEQLKPFEADCALYEGETVVHFAAMHATQTHSDDAECDIDKDIDENTLLRLLLNALAALPADQKGGDWVEEGKLLSQSATGVLYTRERFATIKRNILNAGLSPFAMAVCMLNRRVVNYMLKKDKHLLHLSDESGNNVMHRLATQMKRHKHDIPIDEAYLTEMFQFLMTKEEELFPDNPKLLEKRNDNGYKPIHVAAYNGNVAIFKAIVTSPSVRTELVDYDTMKLAAYRLEDLDSQNEREDGYRSVNVLDVVLSSPEEKATEVFQVTPIVQLIELKWHTYGTVGFTYFFLLNTVYLIALTFAAYYRPLTYSVCPDVIDEASEVFVRNETTASGEIVRLCTPCIIRPFTDSYKSSADWWRLFAELVVILITIVHTATEIADFYRVAQLCPHKKKTNSNETSSQLDCVPTNKDKMLYSYKRFRNGSIGRSFAFTGVKLCTIILAIVAFGMRLGDVEYQDVVVALLTLCAYVYTTVFARDFKFSGPYLLSIYEIMTTIISRFVVIYLFSIMTFGLFFHILFQEGRPEPPEDFSEYDQALVNVFRYTLGLSDLDYTTIQQSRVPALVTAALVLFLVFSVLLLVNFLIALMNGMQDETLQQAKCLWRGQVVSSLFMVERRIPTWLPFYSAKKKKVGVLGQNLLLEDPKVENDRPTKRRMRYLCVHEPYAART